MGYIVKPNPHDFLDRKQMSDLEYGDIDEGLPIERVPKGYIKELEKKQQAGASQCLMMGGQDRMCHASGLQIHDREKYKKQLNKDRIDKLRSDR